MSKQFDPIFTLPYSYISGMNISAASTTVLAIAPGQCRDGNDVIDMPVGYPNYNGNTYPAVLFDSYQQPLFLNSAVVGANGLDAGALAASTEYSVYVIGDSSGLKPTAGLISLTSNSGPLVPAGYDSHRLLGFAATDASTHFTQALTLNLQYAKAFYLSAAVSVLSGGASTTFAAIDMSTPVPTTTSRDVIVYLSVIFTPAVAGDFVQFRPTGSTATTKLRTIVGAAAGIPQQQYVRMIAGVGASKPEIDYLVASASDSVSVLVLGYNYTTA
jgi:hypothetical protein